MEGDWLCGDLIGKCIHCLVSMKETDLVLTTGILLRISVGPVAFLVAKSFTASRIFENDTQTYFHVVPGLIYPTYTISKAISYL